jgi:hypothetical protein
MLGEMTPVQLIAFIRRYRWAVVATTHADRSPEAAVIGISVSDDFELVFDTLTTTRKGQNLRRDPRVALVVGWDDAITLQLEGVADEPSGDERARLQAVYLAAFPDGVARQGLPDITYVRVRPTWWRYSDFTRDPPAIVEGRGVLPI